MAQFRIDEEIALTSRQGSQTCPLHLALMSDLYKTKHSVQTWDHQQRYRRCPGAMAEKGTFAVSCLHRATTAAACDALIDDKLSIASATTRLRIRPDDRASLAQRLWRGLPKYPPVTSPLTHESACSRAALVVFGPPFVSISRLFTTVFPHTGI